MKNPFERAGNAVEEKDPSPEKEISMPTSTRIVYDALLKAGTDGLDKAQLLQELEQHGLVDVADGYDEVPYKISKWDETPEYDIDYVPRYKQLSVYDSDDLNDASQFLMAKGLMKLDSASKKWILSTPERAWEKPLHELPDVKLLKVSVETAEGQIRRYQKDAAKEETFVIGVMDVMRSSLPPQYGYRSHHHEITLANGHTVGLTVSFERGIKERQEEISIELSSKESGEQILLAIEAPEGTLRTLIKIEPETTISLPTSELGFDPAETGLVFRVIGAPKETN